ncbi:MAG: hypothetical protein JW838_04550 [Spirochaetes bacterium]|nr:hypothetical protein [Spirochaetota bacterium]
MRKTLIAVLLVTLFALPSCKSYYTIADETNPVPSMKHYKSIFIGWMPISEDGWEEYGYDNRDQWTTTISVMNRENLPHYAKEVFRRYTIHTATSRNSLPPADAELYVRFDRVKFIKYTSTALQVFQTLGSISEAGNDLLDSQITIIDMKTKKPIYTTHVGVNSQGSGYSDMSFEGRVGNSIYNTLLFLWERLSK